ncbi:MAG: L-lactate permease [Lautropia sp.]
MNLVLWSLPALAVLIGIASGRVNTTVAALIGLLLAIPIGLFSGPTSVHFGGLASALARGLWIGATMAPYILGGLLFWQIAARPPTSSSTTMAVNQPLPGNLAGRRLLFFASFLVGPFAETATGFGVGMLGTVVLLRPLGIPPRYLMIFALLSQCMIPWGAMGSGTLLAAAYARIPAEQLALYCLAPVSLLMGVWLMLFWRIAERAGFGAPASEQLREVAWSVAGLLLVGVASVVLGPETALLATYGPLIVLRYLLDFRPDRTHAWATARRSLPYIALIAGLVLSRLQPSVRDTLGALLQVSPYADLPAWSPFIHAGSWLLVGGILTAIVRKDGSAAFRQEAASAWSTGKHAVAAVVLFAMLAEVLASVGISQAFADALFVNLGEGAVLTTPLLSAAFGLLSNSGTAPNSLFMPSQVALAAQAGLSVPAVAALQHVAASSLGLFSPVRMSIAAGVAGGVGQERHVYRLLLPYAATSMALVLLVAMWIVFSAGA